MLVEVFQGVGVDGVKLSSGFDKCGVEFLSCGGDGFGPASNGEEIVGNALGVLVIGDNVEKEEFALEGVEFGLEELKAFVKVGEIGAGIEAEACLALR